jgi:acetyl esterase
MALNPEIAAFLELVSAGRNAGKRQPMHTLTPVEARTQFDQSSLLMDPGSEEIECVETLWIDTRDGSTLEARLYSDQPLIAGAGLPGMLYLHGGGYVVGSLDSHDSLCRALAQKSGCAIVSVAYRLAPEWRFPTALNDAEDAWRWLLQCADSLGLSQARLAIGGDSVGGSLTTVLADLLAWQSGPRPGLQVLVYPVTDASRTTDSIQRWGEGHLLEKDTLAWFYRQYAGQPGDVADPRFSPLLGAVNASSAPALILLAECDPLHDEGVAYARHLQAGGVKVDLQVYPGMTHDFLRMGAIIDEAEEAQDRIALALSRL